MRRLLLVLLTLLAGCEFTSTPDAAPAPTTTAIATRAPGADIDPCRFVTRDEVSAALGRQVGPPRRQHTLYFALTGSGIGAEACDFSVLGTDERVRVRATKERARDLFTHARTGSADVAGLGVRAAWQSAGLTMWVLDGSTLLSIELPLVAHANPAKDAATAIARAAGKRL